MRVYLYIYDAAQTSSENVTLMMVRRYFNSQLQYLYNSIRLLYACTTEIIIDIGVYYALKLCFSKSVSYTSYIDYIHPITLTYIWNFCVSLVRIIFFFFFENS